MLGLKGHLDWFTGSADLTGTTYRQADGTAWVLGPPEIVVHEWMHALDNWVAVKANLAVDGTEQSRLASEHLQDRQPPEGAWVPGMRALVSIAKAKHVGQGAYWERPSERVAYLFDSYVQGRADQAGLVAVDTGWVCDPTFNGPSLEVAMKSKGAWDRLFDEMTVGWNAEIKTRKTAENNSENHTKKDQKPTKTPKR